MRVRPSYLGPLLAAAGLAATACAGPASTPTPTPTATPTPTPVASAGVSLPRDDAPHPAFNTEWWYYNGHLRTADGRRISFHYAVFQIAGQGGLFADIAHVAVTDDTGSFRFDQRGTVGEAATGAGGFAFNIDGWRMSGGGGRDRLAAGVEGYAFDLDLTAVKPAALHDGTGLVDFGEAGSSYYYSRTRMAATGTVTVGERSQQVTGITWFDHQWGDFEARAIGWDWFALQMDDGVDIMLTVLRDTEGREIVRYGTLVSLEGVVTRLAGDEFSVAPTGSWTSPASGATYPVGWIVRLPALDLDLTLVPAVDAAEFEATATTGNFYWEGPVAANDVLGGGVGVGFVELTGYAPMRFPEPEASPAGTGAE